MTREKALQIFSKGFEAFRLRNGYTQDQVGDILGCGRANINKIKSGKNFPSMEGVFTLVEHGMKLEEIFGAELAEKLTAGLEPVMVNGKPDPFDTPEFKNGVANVLAMLASKARDK